MNGNKPKLGKIPELVAEIAQRYQIFALKPLLFSCRAVAAQVEINIAVLGHFKSGKSSFLDHLFRWDLLPVGVIPVTAVVTEIDYGPKEKQRFIFLMAATNKLRLIRFGNLSRKVKTPTMPKVATVRVELPTSEGLRFVDTHDLEGTLSHNT